jgi:hypothetical protein
MSVKPSISFRNITNYIVEPVGEPIITQPANYSIDFSPQQSCLEEAPDDGKQYARQNKSWSEVSGTGTVTKENIAGLKITDSPEFADALITPLAAEATYSPSVWTYLVGLFTTVPKSVKQHLVEQWNRIFDLNSRLTTIESKVLFETVITEDTARIDITELNISSGVPLKFLIWGTGYESQSAILRINDINTANYHYNVSTIYSYFVLLTYTTRFFNDFSFVLQAGNIIGNIIYAREITGALTGGIIQQSTFGLDISKIETISVIRAGTSTFKAGTHIKLLKA